MLWVCQGADCGARYAVGLPRCPQCSGTDYAEQGAEDMPKITVHGGASVEAEETVVDTERGPELAPVSEVGEPADEQAEGGEQSSGGNSSAASTETQSSSGGTSGNSRQSTARGAANRSKK